MRKKKPDETFFWFSQANDKTVFIRQRLSNEYVQSYLTILLSPS